MHLFYAISGVPASPITLRGHRPISTPGFSDLLLTGEFSHQLQPCTTRLLSGAFWLTTPAHCTLLSLLYHNALRFAMHCSQYSGDEGARTPDLDSAIVALFQLSYIPLMEKIIAYCRDSVK